MFSLKKPSTAELAALVGDTDAIGDLSYSEVGATSGDLPAGYRHDRWQTDLGPDHGDRFDRATTALRHWQPQRGAGLRVFPDDPVRLDHTFVLVIRLGLVYATAGGRVVYVNDEPNRYRFAYGTLTSHPEQGEESFAVERKNERVNFVITAFSRPRHPLARAGAPLTRRLQLRATRRYLRAMRDASR